MFDTSNYGVTDKRLLPISMNKKVIVMFKDELGRKIMKQFCALSAKTCSYIIDDDSEKRKAKGIKRCVIKLGLVFEHYKDSLINKKAIVKSQLKSRRGHHNVWTEEVNKSALNSDDDKILQTFNRVKLYP